MKVIIGGTYYPTLDATQAQISNSATDPVPTCSLQFRDNASTLKPQSMQEILVLDDQATPNPTANLALNPSFNPFGTSWTSFSGAGLTISQQTGGGMIWTFSNCTLAPGSITNQQLPSGSVTPGQTYVFSVYVQGGSSPTNIGATLFLSFIDAGGNQVGSLLFNNGPVPISTLQTRMTVSGTAPAGSSAAILQLGFQRSSTTNSGTITWTQAQFEPEWFPTMTYPSVWCGPSQTNCQQLPLGYWIRQYRRFAGFVNHITAQDYHGNVRTLQVDCVGYAWLMGLILTNKNYTSQSDSAIISNLLTTYLVSNGTNMLSTTNVITGVTVTNVQANWDTLRDIFDGLCGLSTFYWTVDYYWNFIYAPYGYFSQGIGLICDDSSQPNFSTTYPAYNFSAETDFTQPGSTILVLGSGSNVAEVIDPSQTAQLGQVSGYFLPTGTAWMRKVNDSTLASTTDCTTRGLAEMLQYDFARGIYHLTTNVALTPGYSVQITSATEGLSASTQLVQQTQAVWIGTNETLTDEWEYASDLGATNRNATNMISRIFRTTQKNTSAPAISTTTLETFESIGIVDTVATSITLATGYQPTIQADGPLAYYRLSNLQGTTVDDFSGNGNVGTTHNSPTLGVATLLTDPADSSDTAMTFASASSQYISLPTTFTPTGAHPWSIEAWINIASIPATGNYAICSMGTNGVRQAAILLMEVASGVAKLSCATISGDIIGPAISTNTTYHVVGTYDGTSTRLYQNGTLVAGPTAFVLNLAQSFANISSDRVTVTDPFNGTIDEVAFYNYALSSTQVSNHYTAGT